MTLPKEVREFRVPRQKTNTTVNFCGLVLRNLAPIDGSEHVFWATEYFTLFFIPVCPIHRYAVEPDGHASFKLIGDTKWTPGMKRHGAVFLALVLIGLGAIYYKTFVIGLN